MLKTILIILISVTIIGVLFFIYVKNKLKAILEYNLQRSKKNPIKRKKNSN